MEFTPTDIADVVVIDPVVFEDDRGFLMESWQERKFSDAGIDARFVQDVHSRSVGGTIRGLHYQVEQPQGKLVRVIAGEIFDVAVDIRRASPTFGHWVGETLSEGNRRMIWIPPGFAHGFCVQTKLAEIEYRMTDFYAPRHERTIRWDDPEIGIAWPVREGVAPVLADKDAAGVPLKDAEVYA
jgi:dTDP-4-dehydrorhamnose 3,5-epimerase